MARAFLVGLSSLAAGALPEAVLPTASGRAKAVGGRSWLGQVSKVKKPVEGIAFTYVFEVSAPLAPRLCL